MTETAPPATTETRLRRMILALVTLGLVGVGAELWAFAHFEDAQQTIPLFTIGVALLTIAWHVAAPSPASLRTFQIVMLVIILTGVVGIVLHGQGNMEFQLEMDPALSGWPLLSNILHAKAPPALAPGVMSQLGLLGLIYSYRHPVILDRSQS